MEEIHYSEKFKLTSYYLDSRVLYWHQNYTRSLRDQEITYEEYVKAPCVRFGC
jgi:hypothetical protein